MGSETPAHAGSSAQALLGQEMGTGLGTPGTALPEGCTERTLPLHREHTRSSSTSREVWKGAQLRPGDFGLSQFLPWAPPQHPAKAAPLPGADSVTHNVPEQLHFISAGF